MAEVVVRSRQGLTQSIEVGDDRLLADEPVAEAGTAITVLPYAQRKGWPLEGVEVALQHERITPRTAPTAQRTQAIS